MRPSAIGGPLNGVTVVDLTRILAGPYCTMLLADLGARVIKVERPGGGDDARETGPFVDGQSAYFISVNRNKESIALDVKAESDRRTFDALLERADVLVENFRPGTMEKLGYGWDSVHAKHPALVYASISGFGQTGPYRHMPAYDMVVQAMGGIMSLTGQPGSPPTRVGVSIGDIAAGMFAAIGVQAALFERARTGRGSRVDIAMLDCQAAMLENALARYQATGTVPGPIGARHPSITPFDVFHAQDGWLVIAVGNDALFRALCEALGMTGFAAEPRFATNAARCDNQDALKREIELRLAAQPAAYWLELLRRAGVPCSPLSDVAGVMANPQLAERGMLVELQQGNARVKVAGNPVKVLGSSGAFQPAPALDQHRAAILAELQA